jgi:hypothetical protein
MSGLLKALFDAGHKPKTFPEKASLASLTPLAGSPSAREARQATKSVEEFSTRCTEAGWPPESLDAERRFGLPHAKLFPYLGRKVRTPDGPGTLLQAFADQVTVVLDSELSRCSSYASGDIEPVSWRLAE